MDYLTGRSYLEVLDHSPGTIDMRHARSGLPLLFSHNPWDQIGIVENVRVGPDRKLRGDMRFSASPRAAEIARDFLEGIRVNLSAGYDPGDDFTEERGPEGVPIRRYRGWMPMEVSAVAIPADPSVGAFRSADTPISITSNKPRTMNETESPPQSREAAFLQIAAAAGVSANVALDAMQRNQTPEEWGQTLLRSAQRKIENQPYQIVESSPGTQAGEEFLERFAEAIFAPESDAAKRRTRALEKDSGIKTRGNLVALSASAPQRRTWTSTGVGTGKEFSPVLQGDFIDLMRPRLISMEFGAQVERYIGGTVSRPALIGDAAYAWLGENPGSGVATSDVATGAVTMYPHAITTSTTHTQQAFRTSDPVVAEQIAKAHAARLAVGVDAAVLAGTGSSNQPTGVLYGAGVNLVAMGANGGVVTYAKLCELEQAIDAANAPMEGLGFVTTPAVRSRMRQTQDFPSAAAGRPLWDINNTVLGHRAMTTTSMPSTLTKGTSSGNCHAAILGDFSQVVIAYWGALDVIVDPYTDARKGLVYITTTLYVDVGILQPGAFAVIRDLTLS